LGLESRVVTQFILFISIFPFNIKIKYSYRFYKLSEQYSSKHNPWHFKMHFFRILTQLNTRHQAKYVKLNILPLRCIIDWKHGLKEPRVPSFFSCYYNKFIKENHNFPLFPLFSSYGRLTFLASIHLASFLYQSELSLEIRVTSKITLYIFIFIFTSDFGEVFTPLKIHFKSCHSSPKVSQKLSLSNAQFPFNFRVVSVHKKPILTTVSINHK